VQCGVNQTLKDLADGLKNSNQNIKDITFYTIDGAVIPKSEVLKHRDNLPFILNMKRGDANEAYTYAVNLNQSFSIVHDDKDKKSEEAYL